MYLLDTNIILEMLLDQTRAEEVAELFDLLPVGDMCLSDFSLYSIGIILLRRREFEAFTKLVKDISTAGVTIIRLDANGLLSVPDGAQRFTLDFDDAYQYTLAKQYACTLVSLDSDFDRTDRGRKTPVEVIAQLKPPREAQPKGQG